MDFKELEMPQDYLFVTTEDGLELECDILKAFRIGETDYIVLLPVPESEDEEAEEDVEALLYRFSVDEEGSPCLEPPESKEEYELAISVFNELFDAETEFEYNEDEIK